MDAQPARQRQLVPRRGSPPDCVLGCGRVPRSLPAGDGAVVGTPGVRLWFHLADQLERRRPLDPHDPRMEFDHRPSQPRTIPGSGLGHHHRQPPGRPRVGDRQLRRGHRIRDPDSVHPGRRHWSRPVPGLRAVVPVHGGRLHDRHPPVPAPCSGRCVHPLGHRPRAARHDPGDGGRPAAGPMDCLKTPNVGRAVGRNGHDLGCGGHGHHHRCRLCQARDHSLGRDEAAADSAGRRARSAGRADHGPAHDHRRRRVQVLDGPPGRGQPGRSHRDNRSGRPCLRHPLAGDRTG